ncbi:MAG: hypothetical protein HY099_00435, partial [Nitrospirae bacterium]|nr:hypothetical protein [Nitrospirota bacterium]
MKRRYLTILSTGFLILTLLVSCGGGGGGGSSSSSSGSSIVSVTVGGSGQTARLKAEKNTFFAQARMWFRKLMPSEAVAGIPSNINKIVFTISAPDMTTITRQVLVSGQSSITESFTVPTGSNRHFVVEAQDSYGNVPFKGDTYADLTGASLDLPMNVFEDIANAIASKLYDYFNLVNTKGAALTAADIDPYYAVNFGINDGRDRTAAISNDVTNDTDMVRVKTFTKITNLTATPISGTSDYNIKATGYFSDGSYGWWEETGLVMTKESGVWKFKGNSNKSDIEIKPATFRWIGASSTTTYSGIKFYIADKNPSGVFQSAKVKGYLPTNTGVQNTYIIFNKNSSYPTDNFQFASDYNYNNYFLYTSSLPNYLDFLVISDTHIPQIPSYAYTIELYSGLNATGSLVETRTITLPVRPLLLSEVTNAHFPTLGGSFTHYASSINGLSTLPFSYGLPGAYAPKWLSSHIHLAECSAPANVYDKDIDLSLVQNSNNMTLSTAYS